MHAVAVEPSGQQFYTASADGTMRGWDSATRRQLLEFYAPGERVLSLACHPTKPEVGGWGGVALGRRGPCLHPVSRGVFFIYPHCCLLFPTPGERQLTLPQPGPGETC